MRSLEIKLLIHSKGLVLASAVVTAWVYSGLGACTDPPQPLIATAASPSSAPNPSPITQSGQQQLIPAPSLGVKDRGIWSDLDSKISIQTPSFTGRGLLLWHAEKALVIVYDGIGKDAQAVKVYPVMADDVEGAQSLRFKRSSAIKHPATTTHHDNAFVRLWFRPRDAAELKAIINKLDSPARFRTLAPGEPVPGGDIDDDGIPNSLDILIGANKTALNRARYGAGYLRIKYPNGDVPRDVGVCTDVVIRATRNAGIDLQSALYQDIAVAKRFYPMVRKRNRHIDHRRVKTLLPYFTRHWDLRSREIDDPNDPIRPGEVIFFDTFPNRKGPDHIGIVSATIGPRGHLLIINNWTDGAVTQEMDLLSFVPVTHRFRIK